MGRRDAERWLREPGPERPWQIGPLETFTRSVNPAVT